MQSVLIESKKTLSCTILLLKEEEKFSHGISGKIGYPHALMFRCTFTYSCHTHMLCTLQQTGLHCSRMLHRSGLGTMPFFKSA